eukprot:13607701-Ditylum_brightwellii.AAC.1
MDEDNLTTLPPTAVENEHIIPTTTNEMPQQQLTTVPPDNITKNTNPRAIMSNDDIALALETSD